MRIESLSNHAVDLVTEANDRRHKAAVDLDLRERALDEAWAAVESAKRAKPLWQRVLRYESDGERTAMTEVDRRQKSVVAAATRLDDSQIAVDKRYAGVKGETELVAAVSVLSDQWFGFKGYRNGQGEADLVLIGPDGVWVVEVKNISARLHIDGERWWLERLDRWGNVVKEDSATDGAGRPWGDQVGDVGAELAAWLAGNDEAVEVRTALINVNERAELGSCDPHRIDVLTTRPADLLAAISDRASPLTSARCRAIVDLVRRHHEDDAARRTDRAG